MDNLKKQSSAPSLAGVIQGSILGAAVTHELMGMEGEAVDVCMLVEDIYQGNPDEEIIEDRTECPVVYTETIDSDIVRLNMPIDILEELASSGNFGAADSDIPDYFNDADVSAYM